METGHIGRAAELRCFNCLPDAGESDVPLAFVQKLARSPNTQNPKRVWTCLTGLKYTADVKDPLSEFQHTAANREDTEKLIKALNRRRHLNERRVNPRAT